MARTGYPLKLTDLKLNKLRIMAIENDTNINVEINEAISNHIRNHKRRKKYKEKHE